MKIGKNNMKRILYFYFLPILIGFIFLSKVSHSQYLTIKGISNCGTWIEARSPNVNSTALEHYAQGFLNGMVVKSKFDFWQKPYPITLKQSFLWIDKYCRENPLKDPIQGMIQLFDQRKSDTK